MSIIFDALKKAEKKFDNQTISPRKRQAKEVHPHSSDKRKIILIWGFSSLFVFAGLYFIINNLLSSKRVEIRSVVQPAAPAEVNPPKEATQVPQTPQDSKPEIFLNGIFFTDDGTGYALINNSLLKEGDPIEDFRVKSISSDSVTLRSKSSEFTLYYR